MAAPAFLKWPDPQLRTPAADVGEITDAVRAVWDDMVAAMEAMPGGGGVGLAAPQIGVMLRLAIVDASLERGQVIRLADPEIIASGPGTRDHDEASPNLPGVHARLTRPDPVTVAYTNETGARVERVFDGLWATSVQHQIDHLAGRMYFDNLSRTKRAMLLKKAKKGR